MCVCGVWHLRKRVHSCARYCPIALVLALPDLVLLYSRDEQKRSRVQIQRNGKESTRRRTCSPRKGHLTTKRGLSRSLPLLKVDCNMTVAPIKLRYECAFVSIARTTVAALNTINRAGYFELSRSLDNQQIPIRRSYFSSSLAHIKCNVQKQHRGGNRVYQARASSPPLRRVGTTGKREQAQQLVA